MSILESNYQRPWWLLNAHLETIFPSVLRKVKMQHLPEYHEIETKDGDFLELDYYPADSENLVIVSHGLEGNSKRPYVLGMIDIFLKKGWRAIAWNYRTCGTKINRSIRSYHSGFTQDLKEIIEFARSIDVHAIALVGFSLGGNLTLKYLGENPDERVKAAVGISVPLDLHLAAMQIDRWYNTIYSKRFLKSLKKKMQIKALKFPEISKDALPFVNSLIKFDDRFTAPIHGFRDALDYYQSCSSISVLHKIQTPTLIINALNDPFLTSGCYPYEILENHKYVHLITPQHGGHVGFYDEREPNRFWSEVQTFGFINSVL